MIYPADSILVRRVAVDTFTDWRLTFSWNAFLGAGKMSNRTMLVVCFGAHAGSAIEILTSTAVHVWPRVITVNFILAIEAVFLTVAYLLVRDALHVADIAGIARKDTIASLTIALVVHSETIWYSITFFVRRNTDAIGPAFIITGHAVAESLIFGFSRRPAGRNWFSYLLIAIVHRAEVLIADN